MFGCGDNIYIYICMVREGVGLEANLWSKKLMLQSISKWGTHPSKGPVKGLSISFARLQGIGIK